MKAKRVPKPEYVENILTFFAEPVLAKIKRAHLGENSQPYEEFKKNLISILGKPEDPELARTQLDSARQFPSERVADFSARILELVSKAWGALPPDTQMELGIHHFISGLVDPPTKDALRQQRSLFDLTWPEVIRFAQAREVGMGQRASVITEPQRGGENYWDGRRSRFENRNFRGNFRGGNRGFFGGRGNWRDHSLGQGSFRGRNWEWNRGGRNTASRSVERRREATPGPEGRRVRFTHPYQEQKFGVFKKFSDLNPIGDQGKDPAFETINYFVTLQFKALSYMAALPTPGRVGPFYRRLCTTLSTTSQS